MFLRNWIALDHFPLQANFYKYPARIQYPAETIEEMNEERCKGCFPLLQYFVTGNEVHFSCIIKSTFQEHPSLPL